MYDAKPSLQSLHTPTLGVPNVAIPTVVGLVQLHGGVLGLQLIITHVLDILL
jgi:hypothetical protein